MKQSIQSACARIAALWQSWNGEAAYQRYLAHWHQEHAGEEEQPLTRKAFFAAETQRKWDGIKRCC